MEDTSPVQGLPQYGRLDQDDMDALCREIVLLKIHTQKLERFIAERLTQQSLPSNVTALVPQEMQGPREVE